MNNNIVQIAEKEKKEFPEPGKQRDIPATNIPDAPILPPDGTEVIPREQPGGKPQPEIQHPGNLNINDKNDFL